MTAAKTLPAIDFSEIEHGIDVLAQHLDAPDRRRTVGGLLLADVENMSGTAVEDFRRALYACVEFGDSIAPVRAAFAQLAIHSAGAATAILVDRQKRQEAAAHGRKGGRPRKDAQAAEWMRRYDRMAATHRTLTAQERYETIASAFLGTDAKWRTVRNAISEYRKRQK